MYPSLRKGDLFTVKSETCPSLMGVNENEV